MISQSEGFVVRHRAKGMYLQSILYIETDGAGCHVPGGESGYSFYLCGHPAEGAWFIDAAQARWWFMCQGWTDFDQSCEVVPAPCCACCGLPMARWRRMWRITDGTVRCEKHHDRNPCAVEGCTHTTATSAGYYSSDDWLCREHWRQACPPRSPLRRAYRRLWRLHKLSGNEKWAPDLEARYWRLWRGILSRARGRQETCEDLEMEVSKAMGW